MSIGWTSSLCSLNMHINSCWINSQRLMVKQQVSLQIWNSGLNHIQRKNKELSITYHLLACKNNKFTSIDGQIMINQSSGKKKKKHVKKGHHGIIWLVVWNMFYFPYIGNNHPNWLILVFFRGVETTNQIYIHTCIYIYI